MRFATPRRSISKATARQVQTEAARGIRYSLPSRPFRTKVSQSLVKRNTRLTCQHSEFKEAFPAGRFRPVCKIQAKRGGSTSSVAEQIKPPEWWNSTRIIQAFDSVLADRVSSKFCLLRKDVDCQERIVQEAIPIQAYQFLWDCQTASSTYCR